MADLCVYSCRRFLYITGGSRRPKQISSTQVLENTSLQQLAKQIQTKYAYIIDEQETTYILKRQTDGLNMTQQ